MNRIPSRPAENLGYVSADFFTSMLPRIFLVPLFENHDPRQVEIHCYAQVPRPDGLTIRSSCRAITGAAARLV